MLLPLCDSPLLGGKMNPFQDFTSRQLQQRASKPFSYAPLWPLVAQIILPALFSTRNKEALGRLSPNTSQSIFPRDQGHKNQPLEFALANGSQCCWARDLIHGFISYLLSQIVGKTSCLKTFQASHSSSDCSCRYWVCSSTPLAQRYELAATTGKPVITPSTVKNTPATTPKTNQKGHQQNKGNKLCLRFLFSNGLTLTTWGNHKTKTDFLLWAEIIVILTKWFF